MWNSNQYMSESGYNTQAPSVCSMDAFLDNEQIDKTLNNIEANSVKSAAIEQNQQINEPSPCQEEDNAVANWINDQNDSEMALKAIPELLKLMVDDDLLVVQQASQLLFQMTKNDSSTMALIQYRNAVDCIVDCLLKTADLETVKYLLGALYCISSQKPDGVEALINSKVLYPLVKLLITPMEIILSYSITVLHNILLNCEDKVKIQLRNMGAINHIVPLMYNNSNAKFLSIVVDCLQLLAFGNQESKQLILELGGTQMLVGLLMSQIQYQKLVLNITRLLKVLSVGNHNKNILISSNAIQALTVYLVNPVSKENSSAYAYEIQHYCLQIIRNLSDAAASLSGLEHLAINLLQFIALSNDFSKLAAEIISNLTCNESNKRAVINSNGIQILLRVIQNSLHLQKSPLIEPCLCALRHVTSKNSDALLAQEQFRSMNGFYVIMQFMEKRPRSWDCIKASLGLIRNICLNKQNFDHVPPNFIIEKVMQILFDVYTEINNRLINATNTNENLVIMLDGVNLLTVFDLCILSLMVLSKDKKNQLIMRDLECIPFFIQMFTSSIVQIQKGVSSIIVELSGTKECADIVERQPGFQMFIQSNFYNQFGNIKTPAELCEINKSLSHSSTILQNVSLMVQRLTDHRTSLMAQRQYQDPFMNQANLMYYNNQVNMQNVIYNQANIHSQQYF